MMAAVEWTDELIFRLISFYEQNPCLYDFTTPEYRNKIMKREAEKKLANDVQIPAM